jgi:TPR repeat protein
MSLRATATLAAAAILALAASAPVAVSAPPAATTAHARPVPKPPSRGPRPADRDEDALAAPACNTCEGVRLLDAEHFDAARRIFERQSARGDIEAQFNLAWMYQHGLGVAIDYPKARGLYFRAASGGQNIAMNQMGFMYQKGLGAPRDLTTAYCWYTFAIANGYTLSARHIAELREMGHPDPSPGSIACEAINHE